MKAVVLQGGKSAAFVTDRPEPTLRDDYLLVQNKAVALNPTDWKHTDYLNNAGHLLGCDFSGVVQEVGPNSIKSFNKGDRIAGYAHGGNNRQPEDGSFAERILARSGCQFKIPDSWSFEDAATLGIAVMTVGQGLFQGMQLNWPNNPSTSGDFILIYGGSAAMGTMGIQFAKLAGYRVIATSSPHNFDLVKSYGAEAVFNYKDPTAIDQIKQYTNNNLKLVWDTISLEQSADFSAKVIASGGHYGNILPTKFPREDVTHTYTLGYTSMGEPFEMGSAAYGEEVVARDYKWITEWMKLVEQLLIENKLKPHPTRVGKGLENVLEGTDLMRHDKVSGQKLVYVV